MQKLLSSGLLLLTLLVTAKLQAQIPDSDLELIAKETFHDHHFDGREVKFMGKEKKSVIAKYNPVSLVFGAAMFTYQKVVSPQLSADCLYGPSCSAFSKGVIKEFGIIKGIFLTADRLTRCNRISGSDIPFWNITKEGKAKDSPKKYRVHQ